MRTRQIAVQVWQKARLPAHHALHPRQKSADRKASGLAAGGKGVAGAWSDHSPGLPQARRRASGRKSLGQQGVKAGLGLGGGGGLLGLEGTDGFDALGKLALEIDGWQGNRDCLYVLLIDCMP